MNTLNALTYTRGLMAAADVAGLLPQFNSMDWVTVNFDDDAGTLKVIDSETKEDLFWGIQKGEGGPWIVRYAVQLFE